VPAPARGRAIATELVVPWQGDREVARMTREILVIARTTGVHVADAVVEIGRRLERVRGRVGAGQWLEWLAHSVAFERHTARNYVELAQWADAEPAEYRRLRTLGPTKLYSILALPPDRRRALVLGRAMPLPEGRRKTLEAMTVTELRLHLGLAAPRGRKPPIAKVVQGFRHRVAGLGARTAELAARSEEIDHDTARLLHDELAEVLAQLAAALAL
jgi:hypothetical protein